MKKFKVSVSGTKARESIKNGVNKAVDMVKITLGPMGRNVLLERPTGYPWIVNDGVTIAKHIILKDPVENQVAQAIIEATLKTNENVGDGTTTAMVLAGAIINEALKEMGEGTLLETPNVMETYREIKENCQKVIEELKKMAKPIKTKQDMIDVATACCEDKKSGEIIADMYEKLGKDGIISVEDSYKEETSTEIVSGMKFSGGYVSKSLANTDKGDAILEDCKILVTNHQIESIDDFVPFALFLRNNKNISELVIIADSFHNSVLPTLIQNTQLGVFRFLAIKAPSLLPEQYEDIAVYTGATFIDKEKGMKVCNVKLEDLGRAKRIITNQTETAIIEGKGNKPNIEARIKKIKEELKLETHDPFKKRLQKRMGAVAGSIGIIMAGAKTPTERQYIRLKLEDAVYGTKAALEEGVVEGGGLALKKIAEKLPKNILTEALKAPYYQIQENAGGKLKIGKDILDPVKVTRTALENACSAAILITTDGAIVWERSTLEDEMMTSLKRDELLK